MLVYLTINIYATKIMNSFTFNNSQETYFFFMENGRESTDIILFRDQNSRN
uniref:Uncharacterized protein n=1 Tax=Arion vulgaris TaxID=1028688 RepID=A0A0B7APJ1_9EUPU